MKMLGPCQLLCPFRTIPVGKHTEAPFHTSVGETLNKALGFELLSLLHHGTIFLQMTSSS